RPVAPRPNIFELYEQNIGLLQPLLAQELEEAARDYPPEWIEDAFRIAVERNVRHWRYIRAILERWATEGRDGKPGLEHG
ncbi:MAG: DnaD domain protein, partial [Chloroflexi bacterium]|nr:DnaD domain protein [Chloroflexota bacterium]